MLTPPNYNDITSASANWSDVLPITNPLIAPSSHQPQRNSKKAAPGTAGPVVVAVMGATGSGKSTFLTNCGGVGFESGHSLASKTKEPVEWKGTYKGVQLTLLDTPGFGDTNLPDSSILEMIASWLHKNFEAGERINGIIYLHRITDNRMTHMELKNIKMFRKLCGPGAMKNAVLCTSFWDAIQKKEGEDREKELCDEYWKPIIDMGATVERHDNTSRSSTRILDKILSQNGVSLALQEELSEGKTLGETSAGRAITEDIARQELRFASTLRELKQEIDEVLRERNNEFKKILEAETKRLLDAIQIMEEQRLRLGRRREEFVQKPSSSPVNLFTQQAKEKAEESFKFWGIDLSWLGRLAFWR